MFFHLKDLHLSEFRKYVISLYNNNILYDFDLNTTYYLHGLDERGKVFSTISFKLISLNDEEGLINYYLDLLIKDVNKYLEISYYNKDINESMLIGVYINPNSIDSIKYDNVMGYIDTNIKNLQKMKNDIQLPIYYKKP